MSKNQNHGKMKEWRKPEYKLVFNGVYFEKLAIKQRPHVRRKSKSQSDKFAAWMSPLLTALFEKAGIQLAKIQP